MKVFSRCGAIFLICCLMAALLPLPANAGTYDVLTYEITDGEVTITDCAKDATGKVVVPDTIEGHPVTAIGWEAFDGQDQITEIVLPDSIKSIDSYAFRGCTELTAINLPSGLAVLKPCFWNCTKLTSLRIPASVEKIRDDVFWNCKNLSNVIVDEGNPYFYSVDNCIIRTADKAVVFANAHSNIPSDGSVTTIATKAFSGVFELTDVVIPYGITTVEQSAFSLCRNIVSIHLPETVTSFSPVASECDKLSSLTVDSKNPVYHSSGNCIIQTNTKTLVQGCKDSKIPTDGSVTAIGERAFDDMNLTSIAIPVGVTTIGKYAFLSCTRLTSISLPDTLKTVEDEAFKYCSALTSITLPDGLKTVGRYAFDGAALSEIIFPGSVSDIKVGCLSNCKKLQSVTVLNPNAKIGLGASTFYGDVTIYGYTGSTAEAYAKQYSKTFVALDAHTCAYDQKITTSKYQSTPASCTAPAKYFYSCTCGEKGTKTFTHGNALPHTYDGDCDESCNVCGAIRTIRHAFTDEWKIDELVHWHECACGAKKGEAPHGWDNGATTDAETMIFVCTTCGAQRTENIAPVPDVTKPTVPSEPAPTEPAPTVPAQTDPVGTEPVPTEPSAPEQEGPSPLWLIPVFLIVILLLILVIFLLKRKKEKE